MEKPNSVFRKKEAIEVSQAVGQFARVAPGSVTKIMLGVLQKAFTEVAIKPEDWASIDQEVAASMQKGQPTGAGQPQAAGQSGQPAGGDMMQRAQAAPEDVKRKVEQMHAQGASPQDLMQFIQQATGAR
jgi:hypothetical protein